MFNSILLHPDWGTHPYRPAFFLIFREKVM